MKKRFLASLLSLVMLLTMLPMTAFAASTLEAITDVGTLSVTATKDSDSKLTLSVKTAAEEGQEGETVNAYSYLLHTAAVTDDDYLTTLNAADAESLKSVTDGNLGDVSVTTDQTRIIVYTVVADSETDAGKINAWACAEITDAGAGEPSEPGTISTLSFTATKAADNKVTLAGTGDDASIEFSADNAKYKLGAEADLTQPTDADATKLTGYEAYATDITVNDQSHIAVAYIENGKITKWGKAAITPAATTPTTYTITIDEQIENGGVTVAPTGPVEAGTEVTVTATPDANYKLGTITVTAADKKDVTVTAEHKFTMPASDVTVTATFVSDSTPTHTITVTESQNGTVTTNPADSAAEGATVTITATPASGYRVANTTVTDANNGTVSVTDGEFTMPKANVTVTVTFELIPTHNITVTPATNGTVTTSPDKTAAEGEEVTISVVPSNGYRLDSLTVIDTNNKSLTVSADNKFIMTTSDVTVTATFTTMSATEHAITVASTANGTVSTTPARFADETTQVTITTTPATNYEVDEIIVTKTGDANTTVTVTDGKFTMPAYDVTVTVTFKATAPAPAEQYTIEFAANGGTGTMAPVKVDKAETGPTEYPVPASTFTAPTGKEFDVWTVAPSTLTIANGKLSIPAAVATTTEITLTATWKDAAPETPDNTVTMTPEVEGDKASSDFSDSLTPDKIGELVDAAESATDKVVTLDASEVTGNAAVKEAEVTIPTAIVNAVEGSTADVKLAVATPVGTVTLPKDAVTEVKAANTAVKLSIAPATGTGLPTGVVDVKFVKANAATETVEISTPVSLKLKAPAGATKVYAYLYKSVNNAFKAYKLNKDDTAYTVVDGFVTFTAPHLSCYGLSATKNNDAVEEKPAKPTSTATWATSTNFINGLITVSCDAIKSGDKCVVQLTKKPGAGELNLITVVTASEDGKLVFPGKNPKGEDKIAVWILPANANANTATSDDMTNIAYNLSITTATAN